MCFHHGHGFYPLVIVLLWWWILSACQLISSLFGFAMLINSADDLWSLELLFLAIHKGVTSWPRFCKRTNIFSICRNPSKYSWILAWYRFYWSGNISVIGKKGNFTGTNSWDKTKHGRIRSENCYLLHQQACDGDRKYIFSPRLKGTLM